MGLDDLVSNILYFINFEVPKDYEWGPTLGDETDYSWRTFQK